MIGTNRKLLMFFLLLFMAEGSGMVYAKDVYERDLYVEAFTHYFDNYLSDSYKDDDTIYIKQVFGVTDFFPKEIKGHPVRLIRESDCENISKDKSFQIYYIYPMQINFISDTLELFVGIHLGLYWSRYEKSVMRDPDNTVLDIRFIYNKETNEIEYYGVSSGLYMGPIPWIFK